MFLARKTIASHLFRSKIFFQSPLLKYAFTMSPSLKDFKEIMPYEKLPKVDDDLHFPHENEDVNGGIRTLCENLKKNVFTPISALNACMLMYNCGVKNLHEPQVFAMCEKSLLYYENRLPPRLIFGGLYGALKTNAASKSLLNFFIEEFKKIKRAKTVVSQKKIKEEPLEKNNEEGEENENEEEEEIHEKDTPSNNEKAAKKKPPYSLIEYHQLFEACSHNSSLKKDILKQFIVEELKPDLLSQGLKISYTNCVKMIEQLLIMKFYDKELWELALAPLEKQIRFKNILIIQGLYDSLLKSQKSGLNPINLDNVLEKLRNKLKSRVDYLWRYNVEENRFYTFQELKAKRDDYKFPEQSMNLKSPYQKKRYQEYEKQIDSSKDVLAKKKKLIFEKELEELSFERFIKQSSLQEKGTEEEKLLEEEFQSLEEEAALQNIDSEKKGKKEIDVEAMIEKEEQKRREEKEAQKKKLLVEKNKKEKGKLGKGKKKEYGRLMRDNDV